MLINALMIKATGKEFTKSVAKNVKACKRHLDQIHIQHLQQKIDRLTNDS